MATNMADSPLWIADDQAATGIAVSSENDLISRQSAYQTGAGIRLQWPGVSHVIQDGRRLVGCGQRNYSVGTVNVDRWDGNTVTLVPGTGGSATNAEWSPAFIGRRMRIFSGDELDGVEWTILDYFRSAATPPVYQLKIGRKYDQVTNTWKGWKSSTSPTIPPTIGTPASGGSMTDGTHYWKYTFVIAGVESGPSPYSGVATVTTGQQVALSNIGVGPTETTARKIYRTSANVAIDGTYKLIGTISDNVTTSFADTFVDGSGAAAPSELAVPTGKSYVIEGHANRFWWSLVTASGVMPEFVGIVNYKDIDMPGDWLVGSVHAGEYLLLVGRSGVWRTQQVPALDDQYQSAYPLVESIGGYGCLAARTLTDLPDNKAVWLGEGCNVIYADPSGTQIHPVSDRLQGYLTKKFGKDQTVWGLSHAHAQYVKWMSRWIVWFIPYSATAQAPSEAQTITAVDTSATALTNDFYNAVSIDLDKGIVEPLEGFEFTCSTAVNYSTRAGGLRKDAYWAGGADGFIYEHCREDLRGLTESSQTLSAYTAKIVKVTDQTHISIQLYSGVLNIPSEADTPFFWHPLLRYKVGFFFNNESRGNLAQTQRDGDGGAIEGSHVTWDFTLERQFTSVLAVGNDLTVIAVYSWSSIPWEITFRELKTRQPSFAQVVRINTHRKTLRTANDGESVPSITVNAAGGVEYDPDATPRTATATYAQLATGKGLVYLPQTSGQSIVIGLSGTKSDQQQLLIESVSADVLAAPGEFGEVK